MANLVLPSFQQILQFTSGVTVDSIDIRAVAISDPDLILDVTPISLPDNQGVLLNLGYRSLITDEVARTFSMRVLTPTTVRIERGGTEVLETLSIVLAALSLRGLKRIQNLFGSMEAGSENSKIVPILSVNLARSIIIPGGASNDFAAGSSSDCTFNFVDSDNVKVWRRDDSGNCKFAFQVVEF